MAIEKDQLGKRQDGPAPSPPTVAAWLEFDARWLAGQWGLQATGEVKVTLGIIHVGVQLPAEQFRRGEVVAGRAATAIVPQGLIRRADAVPPIAKPDTEGP